MATASIQIIEAIRRTARQLAASDAYQWGHMGLCNCGFLAQQVTHLRKDEIHARAMERHGDWSDQLNDYCATSGLPMDDLISSMIGFGFSVDDLRHLERLSDGRVLRCLPFHKQALQHNVKADVIIYLHAWADMLEQELLSHISLPPPLLLWKYKKHTIPRLVSLVYETGPTFVNAFFHQSAFHQHTD